MQRGIQYYLREVRRFSRLHPIVMSSDKRRLAILNALKTGKADSLESAMRVTAGIL